MVKKIYSLTVASAETRVPLEIDLPNDVEKILGIAITSDIPKQAFRRGTFELRVDAKEVLPEGYPAQLVMCGPGVGPGDRFLKLNLAAETGSVAIYWIDENSPLASFQAYKVDFVFELE